MVPEHGVIEIGPCSEHPPQTEAMFLCSPTCFDDLSYTVSSGNATSSTNRLAGQQYGLERVQGSHHRDGARRRPGTRSQTPAGTNLASPEQDEVSSAPLAAIEHHKRAAALKPPMQCIQRHGREQVREQSRLPGARRARAGRRRRRRRHLAVRERMQVIEPILGFAGRGVDEQKTPQGPVPTIATARRARRHGTSTIRPEYFIDYRMFHKDDHQYESGSWSRARTSARACWRARNRATAQTPAAGLRAWRTRRHPDPPTCSTRGLPRGGRSARSKPPPSSRPARSSRTLEYTPYGWHRGGTAHQWSWIRDHRPASALLHRQASSSVQKLLDEEAPLPRHCEENTQDVKSSIGGTDGYTSVGPCFTFLQQHPFQRARRRLRRLARKAPRGRDRTTGRGGRDAASAVPRRTGLPNRVLFTDRVGGHVERSAGRRAPAPPRSSHQHQGPASSSHTLGHRANADAGSRHACAKPCARPKSTSPASGGCSRRSPARHIANSHRRSRSRGWLRARRLVTLLDAVSIGIAEIANNHQ